jgi:hypothetical protein
LDAIAGSSTDFVGAVGLLVSRRSQRQLPPRRIDGKGPARPSPPSPPSPPQRARDAVRAPAQMAPQRERCDAGLQVSAP